MTVVAAHGLVTVKSANQSYVPVLGMDIGGLEAIILC